MNSQSTITSSDGIASGPKFSAADRADLKRMCGSDEQAWNVELLSRVVAAAWPVQSKPGGAPTQASTIRRGDDQGAGALLRFAKLELHACKPQDEVDGMIAGQAVALHHAAMRCLKLAAETGQTFETASSLRRDAADSARAMLSMVEALDRRRALASAPTPQSDPADGPAWSASSMHPCGGVRAAD